jgi:hypothetical protein
MSLLKLKAAEEKKNVTWGHPNKEGDRVRNTFHSDVSRVSLRPRSMIISSHGDTSGSADGLSAKVRA